MKRRTIALVLALCMLAGAFWGAPSAKAAGTVMYIVTNTLRFYKAPTTSSKSLGVLGYGTALLCTATSGEWAQVKNSAGAIGYCDLNALSASDPNTMRVPAYVNTNGAPIYKVPDASTKVWTRLKLNASFTAVAMTKDNQWVRLQNGKNFGYIEAKYLSTSSAAPDVTPPPSAPETGPIGTVYVTVTDLPVYKSATTGSKCLGHMYYGQSMSCAAVSGEWAMVRNGSATGFCLVSGISQEDPNNLSRTVYINTNKAPVYKKPVAGSAVWTRLKLNASFTAVAVTPDGAWTRLQNGKYFAYIPSQYISDAIDLPTAAPTAEPTTAPTEGPSPANGTVYAIENLVPLRQGADAASKQLATIPYGEALTLTGLLGDWAQVVSASGVSGFCEKRGLSASDPNTPARAVVINTNKAPVYRVPDASSAVWTRLKLNASFPAVAVTPDGQWFRLQNGSYFGYVPSQYVTDPAAATPTPAPTATPAPSTAYVAANLLTVYASASQSAKSLGTISYGESVTLLLTSGVWAQVQIASGAVGYCAASGLTTANPNTYSQTVYIVTANAPIYKVPDASTQVWTKLKKNASFPAVAITPDGQWFRLQNGNYFGYIESKHVSAMMDEGNRTVYVTDTALPVYAESSTSAKGLGSMYFGQSLTLIGSGDGWAKVMNSSGATGYCLIGGLTNVNPNTLNKPYYAKNKSVNLYNKPASGAKTVATVAQDASLMVACMSSDGVWARVALSDGSFAYVPMTELSATKINDETLISDIPPVAVYVVPSTLTVYAATSTASKSLGTMSFGEAMTCTGRSSAWARVVNTAGAVGYCDVNSVSTTNPNVYATPLYAQANGAKVYSKPLTSSKILGTLSLNATVTGVCYNSDRSWYRVQNGSAYGYVQAAFFATTPMADSGQSGKIGAVIALAKQYLGVPYVYGGQSPKGFDCSGFVYYCFKNAAGITLKRTAYTQGYDDKYPKITNKVDLKVGDVVFFNTVSDSDDCDHAGIYLGNNQFIHASSGGGKVMISSLGTSTKDYYFRVYSWARRIIQ